MKPSMLHVDVLVHVNMLKRKALLFGSAFLFGCVNSSLPLLQETASTSHRAEIQIYNQLPVAMLLPTAPVGGGTALRVYIEGDGRAWITASQPSLNPTPRRSFMRELAATDHSGAVYLGRPCQYQKNSYCKTELWTNQRFGQKILDTMHAALNELQRIYKTNSFELVGYSGGATVALLLAAQRTDVSTVQTLAGNLSPSTWVARHQLSPLTGSLDPADFALELTHVRQRHLLGGRDKNTPPAIYDEYLQRLQNKPKCIEFVLIPDASHDSGWAQAWQQWKSAPIACSSQR